MFNMTTWGKLHIRGQGVRGYHIRLTMARYSHREEVMAGPELGQYLEQE